MTDMTRAQYVTLHNADENGLVSPLTGTSVLRALNTRWLIYEHQEQGKRHAHYLTEEGRAVANRITQDDSQDDELDRPKERTG